MIRRAFLRLLGLAPAAALPVAAAQPAEGHWLPVGVVPDWPGDTHVWAHYPGDYGAECSQLSGFGDDPTSYVRCAGIRFWSIPASAPAPPVEEPSASEGEDEGYHMVEGYEGWSVIAPEPTVYTVRDGGLFLETPLPPGVKRI